MELAKSKKIKKVNFCFCLKKKIYFKRKRVREAINKVKGVGHNYKLKAKLRYLFEMLSQTPWNRFPLVIQFLNDKYKHLLSDCPQLPNNLKILISPLSSLSIYNLKTLPDHLAKLEQGKFLISLFFFPEETIF